MRLPYQIGLRLSRGFLTFPVSDGDALLLSEFSNPIQKVVLCGCEVFVARPERTVVNGLDELY
jgi:hypothetical protein